MGNSPTRTMRAGLVFAVFAVVVAIAAAQTCKTQAGGIQSCPGSGSGAYQCCENSNGSGPKSGTLYLSVSQRDSCKVCSGSTDCSNTWLDSCCTCQLKCNKSTQCDFDKAVSSAAKTLLIILVV